MDGWDSSKIEPRLARRLRVSTGEQLDAVGVVKRLGGGTRKYPSVSRIAADPWLRGLAQSDREGLDALLRECRDLHGEELLTAVNWTQFSVFPFEGSAVYRNRHHELEEETEAKGRFTELGTIVERLERHGIPNPYLAVLAADGDAMGKAIAEIRSAPRHREFSEDLSRFAKTAKHVVAAHHGYPIYTGGDDVLALVPMDQALECAWQLRNEFGKLMEKWKGSPTLSVGVAIGHFLEPLEDLLNWARAAEKDAKDSGRNALAVHLYPRAGVRLGACGNWNSPLETRLDRQLTSLAKMHMAEAIPDKAGYDLRELARQYEGWPDASDEEKKRLETAIRADAARLIARKRARQPASAESPLLRIVAEATSSASLRAAADRVILAGHFADAMSQARGKQALEEARP